MVPPKICLLASLAAVNAFVSVASGSNGNNVRALGEMDGFYRYTAVLDRSLEKGTLLWEIPEWMLNTDFPYQKKPFDKEAPFADGLTVVRLLGGWVNAKLPEDRRNDPDDLVWRDDQGQLNYRWELLKSRLDPYVSRGYTDLTLVLDNIPYCLPKEPAKGGYGQIAPPADYHEWYAFIREMCAQLKLIYGDETVRHFRFRMGTEMQDERRFTGSQAEYLEMYDYAAKAVKEEIPDAGFGPFNRSMPQGQFEKFDGSAGGNVDLIEVAKHCATGTNYATGGTGSPLDFVARSFYYFSKKSPSGEIGNVHPDQRMPEFQKLWQAVEALSPRYKNVSREVQEFGPSLFTEGGIYGLDTGARGAAQTLHTLVELKGLGANKIWHWALMERVKPGNELLMSQGWLYCILDQMRGGKAYIVPVGAANSGANTRKALLSVKQDSAILVVANWNVDRTKHTADHLLIHLPASVLPAGAACRGAVALTEGNSVYDVIRSDFKNAGLLSEKHLKHPGAPATYVFAKKNDSMAADQQQGVGFVSQNWSKYLGLMKASLTLEPFHGQMNSLASGTDVAFDAESPSVTVLVFKLQ